MEQRQMGSTDLTVSRLGIGLAEIGFQLEASEFDTASSVLNTALDIGINFLDTAGCYGGSEEFIGKAVGGRRDEYVLASKTGHMSADCPGDSWAYAVMGSKSRAGTGIASRSST